MQRETGSAIKIAAIYAIVAGGWILFSDMAVSLLAPTHQQLAWMQTIKGWFFVAVTALLLFMLVMRSLRKVRDAYDLDGLTGLLSHSSFKRQLFRLSEELSATQVLMVCRLDIDGFGTLNQTVGSDRADEFLRALAGELKKHYTAQDIISRLPPDEFVISRVFNSDELIGKEALSIEKIFRKVAAKHKYELTCSIGVAGYPSDTDDANDLMEAANAALREAKRTGNRICYHNKQLAQAERQRSDLLKELKVALTNESLSLVYQPKYSVDKYRITGVEVLVRWHHPYHGTISPAIFVPLAEENGLSRTLSEFVVTKVAKELPATGLLGNTIPHVSINISATELNSAQAMENLYEFIQSQAQLAPYVRIEITETATLNDIGKSSALIRSLRDRGLSFSVDDFGTGYTSLAMLKDVTVDEIKIDRSFVAVIDSDSRARTIVCAVIAMASNFRIDVVAEGVETEAQLNALREMGCKQVQGYYLAHPMPIEALMKHLNAAPAYLTKYKPAQPCSSNPNF